MNLIQQVENELSNKDWDNYTKARYLYIKSCQIFDYDSRYYFGDDELRTEIINRKIDLENITDTRIVCTSWANQIYIPLLNTIGLDGKLKGRIHKEVEFKLDDYTIKADSTSTSDLTRVKMNLTTYGFKEHAKNYEEKLKIADKKIAYIEEDYKNKENEQIIQNLRLDFENQNNLSNYTYNDAFLIYKLYKIKEILESYKSLKSFEDCRTCINYFALKFLEECDSDKIKEDFLCFSSIEDGDLGVLYKIILENDILYFTLKNTETGYKFFDISESEAKYLIKNKIERRR